MVKPARNVSAAPAVSKPRMVGAHKLYLELCRDYGDPDQAFDELVAFYRLGGSFRVNPHPPYNSEINRVGFCKANPLRWEDPRRWRSGP